MEGTVVSRLMVAAYLNSGDLDLLYIQSISDCNFFVVLLFDVKYKIALGYFLLLN